MMLRDADENARQFGHNGRRANECGDEAAAAPLGRSGQHVLRPGGEGTEVQIAQMRDPVAVKGRRQPRQSDIAVVKAKRPWRDDDAMPGEPQAREGEASGGEQARISVAVLATGFAGWTLTMDGATMSANALVSRFGLRESPVSTSTLRV